MKTTLIITNWVPATLEQEPDRLIHLEHSCTTAEEILEALHIFAVTHSPNQRRSWDWLIERIQAGDFPPPGISGWSTLTSNIQVVDEDNYL